MATRLSDLHFTCRNLLNQESRNEAPERITDALFRAGNSYHGELLGSLTGYQPGRAVPAVSAQITTRVTAELQPFQRETLLPVSAGGSAIAPPEHLYTLRLTARYSQGEDMPDIVSDVEVVTDQKWGYRATPTCLLSPASKTEPIARVTPVGWQVVPAPNSLSVAYYVAPRRPFLAFQLDANGVPLLDPVTDEPIPDDANTIDWQFRESSDAEIIRRAMEMLGLRTGDRPAQEFARATAQQPS